MDSLVAACEKYPTTVEYLPMFIFICAGLTVALPLFGLVFGFVFRLGWLLADYLVREIKETAGMLLNMGVRGVKRLWHKFKRKGGQEEWRM